MLDFNASRGTCIARKTYIAILFFHLMDFMKKEEKKRGKKSKPFHAYVVSFPPPLCAYCQRRFTNSKKLLSNVTSVTVIHCYYTYLVRQCAWRFAREAACRSTEEEE